MYNDPAQSSYAQYNQYGQPSPAQQNLHRPSVPGSSVINSARGDFAVHGQQYPPTAQRQHQLSGQHAQRQPADKRQQRNEMMMSMRKHRSLDGSQFLRELDHQAPPPPPPSYGVPINDPYAYDQYPQRPDMQHQPFLSNIGATEYPAPYLETAYNPKPQASGHSYANADVEVLKRENAALNEKLNYMMNSIKSFWSPELKRERQGRKEDVQRLQHFQDKVMHQARPLQSEIQHIRQELDRREKDITELMGDTDILDMEDELRQLRKQLVKERQQHYNAAVTISPPKDYTDKSLTSAEYHTMLMKLEKSEMALTEKQRELQSAELRLKGAEEQNKELEKRLDIVGRSNISNDAQVKLLQDDVNMLRQKLETRNQLIESKEKAIRLLEKDVDALRQQLQEANKNLHDQKTRTDNQQIRVDQLETLLRERETEIERLKQRLHQQPSTRIESELRQQVHNLELDKRKLQEQIDNMRVEAEKEKQQQLQVFQDETKQLRSTIEYLQKDLADRQILLASQNEKISQLDANGKVIGDKLNADGSSGFAIKNHLSHSEGLQGDLDEARKEVDHLLRTVQNLEKEKQTLLNKLAANKSSDNSTAISKTTPDYSGSSSSSRKGDSALKIRIDELEEALRESVGITSEKDKQLSEQKALLQQLTSQINELYKDPSRRLKGVKTDADVKAWEEERQRYQRQLVNLRKEVTMAAIREKEACIQLLQGPPENIKEKIEILARQKEQLRHRLLTQNNEQYSTSENGPYLANVWMAAQQEPTTTAYPVQKPLATITSQLPPSLTNGTTTTSAAMNRMQHYQQQPYSNYVSQSGAAAGTATLGRAGLGAAAAARPVAGVTAGAVTNPVNVAIPAYGSVPSAPASFTYGNRTDGVDDEGIWA
ncbi:unnamed protein product [Bursaphelenchus xylophilus]|uniref:(pine wood nematode) hypothetical protein n=1 Tax=Bursaphelenchus xylophilus TaxID=6326 RepID=A0A1I7S2E2_BURXY|nr:unnamed protein product [Bursaphelenchus xylophilus]CAG9114629.1 unnamed protein product [Bursaphelenchus xylophilus]